MLKAIILGGFLAGTIDIGAASLITGKDPLTILQFISGGHRFPKFSWYSFSANMAAMLLFGVIVAFFGSRPAAQ